MQMQVQVPPRFLSDFSHKYRNQRFLPNNSCNAEIVRFLSKLGRRSLDHSLVTLPVRPQEILQPLAQRVSL